MITDWKLDFMAKALLEHLWTERKESVLIALDLIKYYYKEEKSNETQSDTVTIQAKLDKANSRLTNLIAMRADGEISKDEYQAMRSPVDEEIKKLQKALDEIPQEKSNPKGLDIEGIRSTLNSFIDFSGSTISHDVVNQFVYLITPTSDTTFDWYVNLNGTADVKATFTAEGRKKNCIIKLEEIEKISSVHREKNEDNAHFIKNPHIFTYLHMAQLSAEQIQTEVNTCADKIEAVTGTRPTLFRCPYGEYNDTVVSTINGLGMHVIQWDVDSLDWKGLSSDEITSRVLTRVQPGSIVLFHNAAEHTPEALAGIIEALIADGYSIIPISQMILPGDTSIDPNGRQCPATVGEGS